MLFPPRIRHRVPQFRFSENSTKAPSINIANTQNINQQEKSWCKLIIEAHHKRRWFPITNYTKLKEED